MAAADVAEPTAPVVPTAPDGLARILVRLPNWLGDVVMAAPAVAAIHRARPDAHLTAQVKAPFMPLAAQIDGIQGVLPVGNDRSLWQLRQRGRELREKQFDAAVVFPRSERAAIAPRRAGIPVRVGYGGSRAFTHGVTKARAFRSAHRTSWFGLLAKAFDAEIELPWGFGVDDTTRQAAERLLLAHGRDTSKPLVVFEPGASYGAAKCWPAESFGRLAARLLEMGADVATVGLAGTRPIEEVIASFAGRPLIHLAGRTPDLTALMGVLSLADLVVSNDTGPMHVAAALGRPTLALFGASDPVVSAPSGPGPARVLYDPEPCSPCFLRLCPVVGHPCLAKIGVARVFRHARDMLDAAAG
ncbi:MAG: lipopolysaccharide heptosyltransferase II [Planctomycetota bacterium]|nr:lipopolysaccharide heptosyltransferase II [Planctomycetota bacterium]